MKFVCERSRITDCLIGYPSIRGNPAVECADGGFALTLAHKAYTVNMMDANAMRSIPSSSPESRVRSVRESELPTENGVEK